MAWLRRGRAATLALGSVVSWSKAAARSERRLSWFLSLHPKANFKEGHRRLSCSSWLLFLLPPPLAFFPVPPPSCSSFYVWLLWCVPNGGRKTKKKSSLLSLSSTVVRILFFFACRIFFCDDLLVWFSPYCKERLINYAKWCFAACLLCKKRTKTKMVSASRGGWCFVTSLRAGFQSCVWGVRGEEWTCAAQFAAADRWNEKHPSQEWRQKTRQAKKFGKF